MRRCNLTAEYALPLHIISPEFDIPWRLQCGYDLYEAIGSPPLEVIPRAQWDLKQAEWDKYEYEYALFETGYAGRLLDPRILSAVVQHPVSPSPRLAAAAWWDLNVTYTRRSRVLCRIPRCVL